MPVPQLKLLLDEEYYGMDFKHHSQNKTTGYRSTGGSSYRRSSIRVPAVSPDFSSNNDLDLDTYGARAPSVTPISGQKCSGDNSDQIDNVVKQGSKEDGSENETCTEVQLSCFEAISNSAIASNRDDNNYQDFISPYELEILSHTKDRVTSHTTASNSRAGSPKDDYSVKFNPDQNDSFDGIRWRSAPPRVVLVPTCGMEINPVPRHGYHQPKYEYQSKSKTEMNLNPTTGYSIHTHSATNNGRIQSSLLPKLSCKKSFKKVNKSAPVVSNYRNYTNNNLPSVLKDTLTISPLNRPKFQNLMH